MVFGVQDLQKPVCGAGSLSQRVADVREDGVHC
jgi:hypothetical protein